MKLINSVSISILAALSIWSVAPAQAQAQAQEQVQTVRAASEYNLEMGVGLKGYDPVSYFPEGGGVPSVGNASLRVDHQGVTYFFATAQNMKRFSQSPEKYEPSYGGWCAYAMASGSKVDIEPMIFTINGNRLHFFVARRAKANFDADVVGHEARADGFWKQISGEVPRL